MWFVVVCRENCDAYVFCLGAAPALEISILRGEHMVFRKDVESRGRARAHEDKEKVRQAFVSAGRKLLLTEDASNISLRRIAAEAGYSPGTIYGYFADSRALYRAVRELDMEDAILVFERIVEENPEPQQRVRSLFLGTVEYWLANPEHFDVLFSMPDKVEQNSTELFGQTPVVLRALNVYYGAVEDLFSSLPSSPSQPRVEADALLAAIYGIIAFPRMTSTMIWSDTKTMAAVVIDSMVRRWIDAGANHI